MSSIIKTFDRNGVQCIRVLMVRMGFFALFCEFPEDALEPLLPDVSNDKSKK